MKIEAFPQRHGEASSGYGMSAQGTFGIYPTLYKTVSFSFAL
jgi:hypothetical protein